MPAFSSFNCFFLVWVFWACLVGGFFLFGLGFGGGVGFGLVLFVCFVVFGVCFFFNSSFFFFSSLKLSRITKTWTK